VTSHLWSEIARPLIQHGAEPAILVSDLELPGIRGGEFCQIVKRHNAGASVVIFSSRPADAPAGVADAVIDKKDGVAHLVEAVRRLLPASGRRSVTPRPELHRRSVLVVEDEVAARFFMRKALENAGFAVVESERADDAIRALDRCDLVLSDVRLAGGTNGLDVLAAAKRRPQPLPVVLVSAFGDAEVLRAALKLRCDEFLDKPVLPEDLVRSVRAALATCAASPGAQVAS
jgi:CheY-like chemotaxis protein